MEQNCKKAIEIAGGPVALARMLGNVITQQAIGQWKRVPPIWVIEVEKATGVSRHDLRPDIYPLENHPKESAA